MAIFSKERVDEAFGEFRKNRFKSEFCSQCHLEDECNIEEEIEECLQLHGYDLMAKIHDGVSYTKEEFEEEMQKIRKEHQIEEMRVKIRGR